MTLLEPTELKSTELKSTELKSTETPYPWQLEMWQRLVKQAEAGRLAHAYLLTGENGTGKRNFAQAFAAYRLCRSPLQGPARACGVCRMCNLSRAGNHPDLFIAQPPEGKSVIPVEKIRELGNFIEKTAHAFDGRVVILEPVSSLNQAAANALLKNLEEPPPGTTFLLLSESPGSVLATIKSRCQGLTMQRPSAGEAVNWLRDSLQHAESVPSAAELRVALNVARGRPLHALSMIEGDTLTQRAMVLKGLTDILERKLSPLELADQCRQIDPADVLNYLLYSISSLVKLSVSRTDYQELLEDAELKAMIERLGAAQELQVELRSGLGRGLFLLYQETLNAGRQLGSSSNANSLLVFEDLFWQWAGLVNSVERKLSANP